MWVNQQRQVLNSIDPSKESLYTICGIIFALAVYNGVSIEAEFPNIFYKQLLGEKIELEDLFNADIVMGQNLKKLLQIMNIICNMDRIYHNIISLLW